VETWTTNDGQPSDSIRQDMRLKASCLDDCNEGRALSQYSINLLSVSSKGITCQESLDDPLCANLSQSMSCSARTGNGTSLQVNSKCCVAYSRRDSISGFLWGTAGTHHHDVKEKIQIIEFISMRVPMRDIGSELLVVVRRRL
jgi:hypothetical protein